MQGAVTRAEEVRPQVDHCGFRARGRAGSLADDSVTRWRAEIPPAGMIEDCVERCEAAAASARHGSALLPFGLVVEWSNARVLET